MLRFRSDWQQWLMMGLIGFTVGIIGFFLHQLIDLIANFKWTQATDYLVNVSLSYLLFGFFLQLFLAVLHCLISG